jgi:hypothetical protein
MGTRLLAGGLRRGDLPALREMDGALIGRMMGR